jgi:hypothetical protein
MEATPRRLGPGRFLAFRLIHDPTTGGPAPGSIAIPAHFAGCRVRRTPWTSSVTLGLRVLTVDGSILTMTVQFPYQRLLTDGRSWVRVLKGEAMSDFTVFDLPAIPVRLTRDQRASAAVAQGLAVTFGDRHNPERWVGQPVYQAIASIVIRRGTVTQVEVLSIVASVGSMDCTYSQACDLALVIDLLRLPLHKRVAG